MAVASTNGILFCGYMGNVLASSTLASSSLLIAPWFDSGFFQENSYEGFSPWRFIFILPTSSAAIIEDIKRICEAGLVSINYSDFDFKCTSQGDVPGLLTMASLTSSGCLSQLYTTQHGGAEQPSNAKLI
jgi:hypothetical protein